MADSGSKLPELWKQQQTTGRNGELIHTVEITPNTSESAVDARQGPLKARYSRIDEVGADACGINYSRQDPSVWKKAAVTEDDCVRCQQLNYPDAPYGSRVRMPCKSQGRGHLARVSSGFMLE